MQLTHNIRTSNTDASQQSEADLLSLVSRFQASPAGRVASAVYDLTNVVNELDKLWRAGRVPGLIDAEAEDIAEAHKRLTHLLLCVSSWRCSREAEDDNEQLRFEHEMRGRP
jgi:hypothetical protein